MTRLAQWTAVLAVCCLMNSELSAQLNGQKDDPSLLPFVTTDEVIRRHAETGTSVKVTGVIQELSGDVVEIRRGGAGKVEAIRLRDVIELRFRKSAEYEAGLRAMSNSEWEKAVSFFTSAEETEARLWVDRELIACRARCLLALGDRAGVIPLVEQILETDPASRHVALLPLVWDERLPESERLIVPATALKSESLARKLTAASALLHDPQHEAAALAELHTIQLSGVKRFQELAELQLWRIRLLHPDRLRNADVELWASRAPDFERQIRGPAEFLLGRAYLHMHAYDRAVTSFLWLPFMHPDDRALAAASLSSAAIAMETSGRPLEARQLTSELLERFPETSTAKGLASGSQEISP